MVDFQMIRLAWFALRFKIYIHRCTNDWVWNFIKILLQWQTTFEGDLFSLHSCTLNWNLFSFRFFRRWKLSQHKIDVYILTLFYLSSSIKNFLFGVQYPLNGIIRFFKIFRALWILYLYLCHSTPWNCFNHTIAIIEAKQKATLNGKEMFYWKVNFLEFNSNLSVNICTNKQSLLLFGISQSYGRSYSVLDLWKIKIQWRANGDLSYSKYFEFRSTIW